VLNYFQSPVHFISPTQQHNQSYLMLQLWCVGLLENVRKRLCKRSKPDDSHVCKKNIRSALLTVFHRPCSTNLVCVPVCRLRAVVVLKSQNRTHVGSRDERTDIFYDPDPVRNFFTSVEPQSKHFLNAKSQSRPKIRTQLFNYKNPAILCH